MTAFKADDRKPRAIRRRGEVLAQLGQGRLGRRTVVAEDGAAHLGVLRWSNLIRDRPGDTKAGQATDALFDGPAQQFGDGGRTGFWILPAARQVSGFPFTNTAVMRSPRDCR